MFEIIAPEEPIETATETDDKGAVYHIVDTTDDVETINITDPAERILPTDRSTF